MKKLLLALAMTLGFIPGVHAANYKHPSEREAVAATLVLEAGGTGERGMLAVMWVIRNRAAASRKTYYSIVTAPKQFAVMTAGPNYAITRARKHPQWGNALRIYDLFTPMHTAPGYDLTGGATHFESFRHRKPYWARKMILTLCVNGNCFYRPRK